MILALIALVALAVQSIYRQCRTKALPISPGPMVARNADEQLPDWIRSFPAQGAGASAAKALESDAALVLHGVRLAEIHGCGAPWLIYAAAFGGFVYLTLAHLRRESLRQKLRSLPFLVPRRPAAIRRP